MQSINSLLLHKCGVYIITNLTNGHKYVGSSKNLRERLCKHVYDLDHGRHINVHLQRAWDKYGKDSFEYGILAFCEENDQYIQEQKYIDIFAPEYNINPLATNSYKSEETKAKISKSIKQLYDNGFAPGKKYTGLLYVYDINSFELVKEATLSELGNIFYKKCGSLKLTQVNSGIIRDKYVICSQKFETKDEARSFICKNILTYKTNDGRLCYLIIELDGIYHYFKTTAAAVQFMRASSVSTLRKHNDATINSPYCIPNTKYKMFMSNKFLGIVSPAVLIEKSSELPSGNIGESPKEDNTEINSETKESESSYSVDSEPLN